MTLASGRSACGARAAGGTAGRRTPRRGARPAAAARRGWTSGRLLADLLEHLVELRQEKTRRGPRGGPRRGTRRRARAPRASRRRRRGVAEEQVRSPVWRWARPARRRGAACPCRSPPRPSAQLVPEVSPFLHMHGLATARSRSAPIPVSAVLATASAFAHATMSTSPSARSCATTGTEAPCSKTIPLRHVRWAISADPRSRTAARRRAAARPSRPGYGSAEWKRRRQRGAALAPPSVRASFMWRRPAAARRHSGARTTARASARGRTRPSSRRGPCS